MARSSKLGSSSVHGTEATFGLAGAARTGRGRPTTTLFRVPPSIEMAQPWSRRVPEWDLNLSALSRTGEIWTADVSCLDASWSVLWRFERVSADSAKALF